MASRHVAMRVTDWTTDRGFLKWMLPGGTIPVVQMSLRRGGSMEDHIELGRALEPLRSEGILIVGSGSAVHNVREMSKYFGNEKVRGVDMESQQSFGRGFREVGVNLVSCFCFCGCGMLLPPITMFGSIPKLIWGRHNVNAMETQI